MQYRVNLPKLDLQLLLLSWSSMVQACSSWLASLQSNEVIKTRSSLAYLYSGGTIEINQYDIYVKRLRIL